MEEVVEAAKAARIHDYIESLPAGYHTLLSDNGINISKGQKQLLTIARAMLLDCKMLILDEATSNVDTRTEQQIQAAMRTLMRDKTCFVIAHRLSTIRGADNILVIRDGDAVSYTHLDVYKRQVRSSAPPLRGRWRWIPMYSCSTNPLLRWIRKWWGRCWRL